MISGFVLLLYLCDPASAASTSGNANAIRLANIDSNINKSDVVADISCLHQAKWRGDDSDVGDSLDALRNMRSCSGQIQPGKSEANDYGRPLDAAVAGLTQEPAAEIQLISSHSFVDQAFDRKWLVIPGKSVVNRLTELGNWDDVMNLSGDSNSLTGTPGLLLIGTGNEMAGLKEQAIAQYPDARIYRLDGSLDELAQEAQIMLSWAKPRIGFTVAKRLSGANPGTSGCGCGK
jgi:hypothetical protein